MKPHLAAVAAVENFLPGIAERLGDPNFTKGLAPRKTSLVRFMEEPTEHLIDTVNALDDQLQAALILVYVHQAGFDPSDYDQQAAKAVADLTGYSITKIQDSFTELKGSFLKLSGPRWTFAHPTISDALTEVMRQKPHMMAALIRGAPIDTILGSFTCEGSPLIRDALVIPTTLDDALVARLGRTPDELHRNRMLFHFLYYRASEVVFSKAVQQNPDLLERLSWWSSPVVDDPKLATHGRANRLGLLLDHLREEAADRLVSAVQDELDASFFEEEDMLGLLSPLQLVGMGMGLRTTILPSLEDRIDEIASDADLDDEPDSHFVKLLDFLDRVEAIGVDPEAAALVEEARDQVGRSIDEIEERKRERDEEDESDTDWTHIVTREKEKTPVRPATMAARSSFDDIDK